MNAATRVRACAAVLCHLTLCLGCTPPPPERRSDENRRAERDAAFEPTPDAAAPAVPVAPRELPPDDAAALELSVAAKAHHPMGHGAPGWNGLAAKTSVPSWSTAPGDGRLTRDDDLLTAWTCESAGDERQRCALSLHFPEQAKVRLIRLFGSLGETQRERYDAARAKTIKLHTGTGWAEATLPDHWAHQYLLLDRALETRVLTLEIVDVHPGRKSTRVGIAELEVFGPTGIKREPLELDPRLTIIRGSPHIIRRATGPLGLADSINLASTWVEQLDRRGGKSRRLFAGTGVLGSAGDRYMLIVRVEGWPMMLYDRSSLAGSYVVVDRTRRAFFDGLPLDINGTVYRHGKGLGVGVASFQDQPSFDHSFEYIGHEEDGIEHHRKGFGTCDGYACPAVSEHAKKLDLRARRWRPPGRCTKLSKAAGLALLPTPNPLPGAGTDERLMGWTVCDGPAGYRLLQMRQRCGPAPAVVLDAAGNQAGPMLQPSTGCSRDNVAFRRLPDGSMLLETAGGLRLLSSGGLSKVVHRDAVLEILDECRGCIDTSGP